MTRKVYRVYRRSFLSHMHLFLFNQHHAPENANYPVPACDLKCIQPPMTVQTYEK